MISITTVDIHMQKHRRTQIHKRLRCSGTNVYWLLDFFRHKERERQFLKVFRIILCRQNSQLSGRTPTSQQHGRNSTSIVCLNGRQPNCLFTWPKVNLPTSSFSKSPNSQPIASGHDVIHTPATFPIWGLLWQLWLSYPLCANVNCTQCLCTWTNSQIVQSPTKLNDKI